MAQELRNIVKSPASYRIYCDNQEIPGSYQVASICVVKEVNKVASAQIQLFDGGLSDNQGYEISDSKRFNPGVKIKIELGYADALETVFEGIVIKHGLRISQDGFMLEIDCRDEAIKSTVGRKNKIFASKTDSDIISEILSAYGGLSVNVESTSYKHAELLQNYIVDWDFVIQRADVNGMLLLNSDGKISVVRPDISTPVIELSPDGGVIEFNAFIDAINMVNSVKGLSWDMDNQEVIEATSSLTSTNKAGGISSDDLAAVMEQGECTLNTCANIPMEVLTEWASALHSKLEWSKVRGDIKINGYNGIVPGDTIELTGFSNLFNGPVYVSSVEHVMEEGVYTSVLGLGLSPNWYVEERHNVFAPPASALIPPVPGLQVGVVQKIHEDEYGQYRVQVSLPSLQSETLTLWARLTSLYATANAGMFFYPEIGDEVIVGFLNQDPQSPIILGSVFNKVNTPPEEPAEENFFKRIVTREQLKISFDEENKAIILETPEANTIILNDTDGIIKIQDMNDNSLVMSSDGVTIESAGDIKVNAKGNIEFCSEGDIAMKATGDVKIEGMNIENKGQAKFAAEGANCEVKGSAQTVIKGGIVMIN